jgi:hypothetical protein
VTLPLACRPARSSLALALWAGVFLAACTVQIDHGAVLCGPETCTGCCSPQGVCLPGESPFACGALGGACARCPVTQACESGVCGGQAEASDAGAAAPPCGPGTCAGCCWNGQCFDGRSQSVDACGFAGGPCEQCDASQTCAAGACTSKSGCVVSFYLAGGYASGTIDFGDYPVGAVGSTSLEARNTGTQSCVFGAPTWLAGSDQNAFSFGGATLTGFTLARGESTRIPLTFAPWAAERWVPQENGFTLEVNDGAPSQCPSGRPGCRLWRVSGGAVKAGFTPVWAAAPSRLDFGKVSVGCRSAWRTVQWVNASEQPTSISAVSVGAPFALGPTALLGSGAVQLGPSAFPLTVPPWRAVSFAVRFEPTAQGSAPGELWLTRDGTAFAVPLEAEGVEQTVRTFAAVQQPPGRVDVLFVVHGGAQMGPLRAALSQAAPHFVAKLSGVAGSFRIGVITTDVTEPSGAGVPVAAGRLQGSPRWVSPSSAAGAELAQNLAELLDSSAPDQGLEALRLALLPPNVTDPLRNGGFRRQGARLAVILVSNAEEKSGGAPAEYLRTLLGQSGEVLATGQVRAYGLLSGTGCHSGRYAEFLPMSAERTCYPLSAVTLKDDLSEIALALLDLQSTWALPGPVDDGQPVTVLLDAEREQTIPEDSYTLDATTGLFRFAHGRVPEPGSTLEIVYTPSCQPP